MSGWMYEFVGNKVYIFDEFVKMVFKIICTRKSTAYISSFIMKAFSCSYEWFLWCVLFFMFILLGLMWLYIDV